MGKKVINKSCHTIALDTNIFIYHFEENKRFLNKTTEIFSDIEKGKCRGVSSIISLVEILTLPKRKNDYILVRDYNEILLNFPNLKFIDVNWEIADWSSSIRAKYNITTPDSIQIATAICHKAEYFLTADKNFKKIKDIKVKLLQESR